MNEMSTVFQKEPYSKNEAGLALASKHYIFLFNHIQLVGGFKDFFVFTRIPGKMIQLDEHIFQMGWFNHQRVNHSKRLKMGFLPGIGVNTPCFQAVLLDMASQLPLALLC